MGASRHARPAGLPFSARTRRRLGAALAAVVVVGGGSAAVGGHDAKDSGAGSGAVTGARAVGDREVAASRSQRRSLTHPTTGETDKQAAERAAERAVEPAAERKVQRAAEAKRKAVRAAARRAARTVERMAARRGVVLASERKAAERLAAARRAKVPGKVVGTRFLTTALNLWSGPGESYRLLKVLPTGSEVAVTGRVRGGWAEVVRGDTSRWVAADYLAASKPEPAAPAPTSTGSSGSSTGPAAGSATDGGISSAPCASGSAVEAGLTPDAIRVHRGVCARFPSVTVYGGLRSDGEHGQGRALDIMVSDQALGTAIAEWVRANSGELGASEVLWAQRIWTVQRSSEGWRLFEDRGSVTGNHFDHVHVTVYGGAG